MKLNLLNKEELGELYRKRMMVDFPKAELKPLRVMYAMMDANLFHPLLVEENGENVGYAMVCPSPAEDAVLLEYLGVFSDRRNSGLGAKILDALALRYGGLFGEAEAPDSDDPAENALRTRRLGFYQRCGFRILNYDCGLFGVHFKCLYRGPEKDDSRVCAMHRGTYGRWLSPKVMESYVQMPLREGETINIPPDDDDDTAEY